MQLTPGDPQIEQENVQFLASMMGGDLDLEAALRVLRKHNGNVEKAADAVLQGDRGEDMWLSTQDTSSTLPQVPPAPSGRVIDLTEDDDMSRALQMSMETSSNEVRFGPSDRAPDPAWQLVPPNSPRLNATSNRSQEDQHLKEAIRASLKDLPTEESDAFPFEDTPVREGGRPVALRSESPELAYAALVVHALFHVPQIREQIATMPLPIVDGEMPKNSSSRAISNIVEYFVNLDLAQLSTIVDRDLLNSLQAQPIDMTVDNVGDCSSAFLKSLAHLISSHLDACKEEQEPGSRLFFFSHGNVEFIKDMPRRVKRTSGDGFVVVVDVGLENMPNDLIGVLSANLTRSTESGSSHDVITELSDVVAFRLAYNRPTNASRSSIDTFVYPKIIYLDRFLLNNAKLAEQRRQLEQEMNTDIAKLTAQKEFLTGYNNRDTLADLRSTLHYFENVAIATDEGREQQIRETTAKLKSILAAITDRLETIDRMIERLRAEVSKVFDIPAFQFYRYDLRAVLVHTGLPGRKQMYSYVQDTEGIWWKTVDFTVTEVAEETVLTDPSGLHMGAGPYLLLYSRYAPQDQIKAPLPWPTAYVDIVEHGNKTLFSLVPSELAAKAKIPPSVSSPSVTSRP
ncbi:hypothetical protein AX15_000210 [Amanita polypyramis BW_CC]|nr:hypothetical protein AX15_000210 [Amanita polypyramis BW_CC]